MDDSPVEQTELTPFSILRESRNSLTRKVTYKRCVLEPPVRGQPYEDIFYLQVPVRDM